MFEFLIQSETQLNTDLEDLNQQTYTIDFGDGGSGVPEFDYPIVKNVDKGTIKIGSKFYNDNLDATIVYTGYYLD